MGTMIQRQRLSAAQRRSTRFTAGAGDWRGNLDVLSLTRPEIILDIHRQYLEAGADVISTNTFNGTTVSQAVHGLAPLVGEMNRASARLARHAADAAYAATGIPRFVAGVLGPTNRAHSGPGDRHELTMAYAQACGALIEGGADVLLVETVVDLRNAQAALEGARAAMTERGVELPAIVSVVIDDAGNTLSGHTLDTFWQSIRAARPALIGFNCVAAHHRVRAPLEALGGMADCGICLYPSAGLPDSAGHYEEAPARIVDPLGELARAGLLNLVGGCCGTTPDFIRALAGAVRGLAPRAYHGAGL